MIDIRRVSVADTFDDARRLAELHWLETEQSFSAQRPELDIEAYRALESIGACIAFAAFNGGLMVGYVCGFVVRHMHYNMIVAQHDVLFLHPDYRKSILGIRLIRCFERAAIEAGAERILWHAKIGSQFERILQRMGCKPEEMIYCKEI